MSVVLDEGARQDFASTQDALVEIAFYLDAPRWALLLITILGISVMLWARIDHRRETPH